MMEELVLVEGNFFSDFSGLSFFLLRRFFFFCLNRKSFWFRASIPQMLIFFFFFPPLPLHLDYAVSLRMVKKEHGVWLDLAHRRLTSSVYLITGQTGGKGISSLLVAALSPKRRAENEKLEPLAAERVKKKRRREGAKM